MALEHSDVQGIAHLARLQIDDSELDRYAVELSAILDFVEQMNQVDTESVDPMAHPLDAVQPLRPDVVTEPDRREALQAHAPAVSDGLYLVPKVIE